MLVTIPYYPAAINLVIRRFTPDPNQMNTEYHTHQNTLRDKINKGIYHTCCIIQSTNAGTGSRAKLRFFLDLQLVKLAVFVTHQGDELLGEVKAYETGA